MTAHRRFVFAVLSISVASAACASQRGSQLDGPIDYQIQGGFSPADTLLHIELDGSATEQVTPHNGQPTTTHGTVAAAVFDALRADVAAVELESFRSDYNCSDFQCGADANVVTLTAGVDGGTTMIRVDRNIASQDLPPGLVKILEDLDGITDQIR